MSYIKNKLEVTDSAGKTMDKIEKVKKLIVSGNELLQTKETTFDNMCGMQRTFVDGDKYKSWVSSIKSTMQKIFGDNSEEYKFFAEYKYPMMTTNFEITQTFLTHLNTIFQDLEEFSESNVDDSNHSDPIKILQNIFEKFSLVAAQLLKRHNNKSTLVIENEYDVQDLLHAILKLHFDDIRSEEDCPRHGGTNARVDFALKNEKIFIEVKMASKNLTDKKITKQITNDIAEYKTHQDCKCLVCFIYDPLRCISNKKGVIKDIENTNDLNVKVFIEH